MSPLQLNVIEIRSLTSNHTEAVKGVDALVHCASPGYTSGETGEEILEVGFRRLSSMGHWH